MLTFNLKSTSCKSHANSSKKAIIRQKGPIVSVREKPRMANENSCPFKGRFPAYPMARLPNTLPVPTPDPETYTVAAPAPIYSAV